MFITTYMGIDDPYDYLKEPEHIEFLDSLSAEQLSRTYEAVVMMKPSDTYGATFADVIEDYLVIRHETMISFVQILFERANLSTLRTISPLLLEVSDVDKELALMTWRTLLEHEDDLVRANADETLVPILDETQRFESHKKKFLWDLVTLTTYFERDENERRGLFERAVERTGEVGATSLIDTGEPD